MESVRGGLPPYQANMSLWANVDLMTVYVAGPTLNQRWPNNSSVLGSLPLAIYYKYEKIYI